MTYRVEVHLELGRTRRVVGRLLDARQRIHFEYDPRFLGSGLELSPLKLPLRPGVFSSGPPELHGLYGLFDDSLPDGWGLMLMHRRMRERGIDPARVSVLAWLQYLGERGMGALTYHPPEGPPADPLAVDLAVLAAEAVAVYEGRAKHVLPALELAGGSPGGDRPKVAVAFGPRDLAVSGATTVPRGYEHWLVKFSAKRDPSDAGALEEAYAGMARNAGIDMPATRLIALGRSRRCFAVKRFDRVGNARVHVHTLGGLLHATHRAPSLDYKDFLAATFAITRSQPQVLEAFRRAAFNVLACNRDDHTRNFAYLMDERGAWRLAPAYDLTLSEGIGGHHTTSLLGEGLRPRRAQLLDLAALAALPKTKVAEALGQVEAAVADFGKAARAAGVMAGTLRRAERRLAEVRRDYAR